MRKRTKKRIFGRIFLSIIFIFIIAIGLYLYVNTKNDFLWLSLDKIDGTNATTIYHINENGEQEIYAQLPLKQEKTWVEFEEIPIELQQAFIAIEDRDFYSHFGISITRTIYAALNEVSYIITGSYIGGDDGMQQGASTLTQQLVKNMTSDDTASGIEGYLRKVREIYRAILLEIQYEKDEILEAYLNIISFTENTAGIQAESMKLFNKPVSELTLEQCASLASITKNPYGYNPVTHPEEHLARRNYVLYEMWQQGYITQEEYENASIMPIGLAQGAEYDIEYINEENATDELIAQISDNLKLRYNLSESEIEHLLYYSGLQIYIDLNLNNADSIDNLLGNIQYNVSAE